MTKQQYKQTQQAKRLEVRKAINRGFAIPIEYGAKLALLASIHAAIAPKIETIRAAEITFGTRGLQNQENENGQSYVVDSQKYRDKFAIGHKVATGTDTDLAVENEPRFAIIQESAKIAESAI